VDHPTKIRDLSEKIRAAAHSIMLERRARLGPDKDQIAADAIPCSSRASLMGGPLPCPTLCLPGVPPDHFGLIEGSNGWRQQAGDDLGPDGAPCSEHVIEVSSQVGWQRQGDR
jgi:hypothetical protein